MIVIQKKNNHFSNQDEFGKLSRFKTVKEALEKIKKKQLLPLSQR